MVGYKNSTHIFSWIAVFLWMVLIFNLSSQMAEQSDAFSSGIAETVIEVVEKIAPQKAAKIDVGKLNHLIRKGSHFLVFLALGVLFMCAIRRNGIYGIKGVVITLLFCSLYAILDEVHQLFVSGRGAQISDVFIDIVGAAAGILGYLGISKLQMLGSFLNNLGP